MEATINGERKTPQEKNEKEKKRKTENTQINTNKKIGPDSSIHSQSPFPQKKRTNYYGIGPMHHKFEETKNLNISRKKKKKTESNS